jgi:amidase
MNVNVARKGARVWQSLWLALTGAAHAEHDGLPPDVERQEIIIRMTATELQQQLQTGALTALDVSRAFLARIGAVDKTGPSVNAIIEINPDAETLAAELDTEFAARGPRGPLHGLPVVLKASIDTGDRMATSAGSLALAGHRAPRDAHVVARLRAAGAVVLGKTNMSEWANFRSTRSTSGWSSLGGQTRNPYVLDRNPCGSSSGSAVAVAALLAPLALGTETDGSIVCPAGINGIVGVKPTVGTVSRSGIIPISQTLDTPGPMARTVADAALLLQAMIDADPQDSGARGFPGGPPSLLPDPQRTRLDGLRVGVLRSYVGAGKYPAVDEVYQSAVDVLAALGATVVDPLEYRLAPEQYAAEYEVMLYEFRHGLNAYLASGELPHDRSNLAAIIAWNEAHPERTLAIFDQEVLKAADAKGDLTEEDYLQALETGPERVRADLAALLAEHDLDALVGAANSFAWKTDWLAGDRFMVGSSTLAAMAGFPSVSVPAGQVSGLPVGVAFVGAPFSEARLLQIAYVFEQSTRALREPAFLPTLEKVAAAVTPE